MSIQTEVSPTNIPQSGTQLEQSQVSASTEVQNYEAGQTRLDPEAQQALANTIHNVLIKHGRIDPVQDAAMDKRVAHAARLEEHAASERPVVTSKTVPQVFPSERQRPSQLRQTLPR